MRLVYHTTISQVLRLLNDSEISLDTLPTIDSNLKIMGNRIIPGALWLNQDSIVSPIDCVDPMISPIFHRSTDREKLLFSETF